MYVYVLGGFLGSGKTSLLMKLASMYTEKRKRVAILVNESGQIGVDGATMRAKGYNAIELPDGCVCCTLSSSLQSALKGIKEDIDPDVLLIEPTGLALPHKVREIVGASEIDEEETIIIGIADVQRFEDLITKREEFFKRQMQASDFILLNKTDLSTPEKIKEITGWLKEKFPEIPVLPVSVKTGENFEKVEEMMK